MICEGGILKKYIFNTGYQLASDLELKIYFYKLFF